MKAVILARVSTEEQKEAGNSLPAQQARLRNYIERNNLKLIKEFIFDESASKENRKEFSKVVDFLKEQKETIALCCDKIDRLSRDFLIGVIELERLRREGRIELHFASDGIHRIYKDSNAGELLIFNILLSASQNFANSISDNTKRAFERKRAVGEITGQPPIGYMSVPLDKNKRTRSDVVFDSVKAPIVKRLFEIYATGNYSITTLWEEAKRFGLKAKNGKLIARSVIEHILRDEFYYGIANSKKYSLRYPHRYKSLITKELFEKCRDIREGRKKKPSQMVAKPFIFRGLITCKHCGCLMSPEIKKGKFIYYSCTNAKGNCKKVYVPEKELLGPVYEVLQGLRLSDKHIQEITEGLRVLGQDEGVFHRSQMATLKAEYDTIENRLEKMYEDRLDGRITDDMYDKKLKAWKERQEVVLAEMQNHSDADEDFYLTANTVLNLAQRAIEIFKSSEVDEKRQLLNYLLQNCQMDGKKLEFSLRNPFNRILEISNRPTLLPG